MNRARIESFSEWPHWKWRILEGRAPATIFATRAAGAGGVSLEGLALPFAVQGAAKEARVP